MYNNSSMHDNCTICQGKKKIEIGRNLDNELIETLPCPICNAKGYITIIKDWWTSESHKFWKRMNGE